MKKLFCLFMLFMAFAAQAQGITENVLLGKWNFIGIGSEGNYVDFETDSIYMANGEEPSDAEKADVFGPNGLKEEITGSYVIVKPGLHVECKLGSKFEEGDVLFVQQDNTCYIANGNKKMGLVMKDGLLFMYPNSAKATKDGTYVVMKREKEE